MTEQEFKAEWREHLRRRGTVIPAKSDVGQELLELNERYVRDHYMYMDREQFRIACLEVEANIEKTENTVQPAITREQFEGHISDIEKKFAGGVSCPPDVKEAIWGMVKGSSNTKMRAVLMIFADRMEAPGATMQWGTVQDLEDLRGES